MFVKKVSILFCCIGMGFGCYAMENEVNKVENPLYKKRLMSRIEKYEERRKKYRARVVVWLAEYKQQEDEFDEFLDQLEESIGSKKSE